MSSFSKCNQLCLPQARVQKLSSVIHRTKKLKVFKLAFIDYFLIKFTYCQYHAVIFSHRSVTTEECDKENDASNHNEKHRQCEELMSEKISITMVDSLDG